MIFFWLSTSQLPWATFEASFNPHFGQKTKLSCSCCARVEQKKKEELRNRSFFSANTWGLGRMCCEDFEMCCEDFEMCCEDFEMCCEDSGICSEFKMCFEEFGMCFEEFGMCCK